MPGVTFTSLTKWGGQPIPPGPGGTYGTIKNINNGLIFVSPSSLWVPAVLGFASRFPNPYSVTPSTPVSIDGKILFKPAKMLIVGLTLSYGNGIFEENATFDDINKALQLKGLPPLQLGGNLMSLPVGAVVAGNGILQAPAGVQNTDGEIDPGGIGLFGSIAVQGGYTQAAGGTLNIDLDNPDASDESDSLEVDGGSAELGGTLNVNFPDGFLGTNQTYTILTDAEGISGTFANVNVAGSGYATSSYGLAVRYTATAVYLDVVAKASTPTISSLSTSSSTTIGDQDVTITGTNFVGVQTVLFGDEPATSFTVVSSTEIDAVAPANPTSATGLTVVTASGSATASFGYTAASVPVVSSLTPASGYLSGGEEITITGSNLTGTTGVSFGSEAALDFYVVSDTEIIAFAPAATAAGTVDVTVSNHSGTSATVSGDTYTYTVQPAPTVTSLDVTSGSADGSDTVTITGTNFANVDDVFFGGVAANFTVVSSTSITATALLGWLEPSM